MLATGDQRTLTPACDTVAPESSRSRRTRLVNELQREAIKLCVRVRRITAPTLYNVLACYKSKRSVSYDEVCGYAHSILITNSRKVWDHTLTKTSEGLTFCAHASGRRIYEHKFHRLHDVASERYFVLRLANVHNPSPIPLL